MKTILDSLIVFVRSRNKAGMRQETLLSLFDRHNAEYRSLIGHGRSFASYKRYGVVYRHLRLFLQKRVTFHLARHTFATLSLSKGVPIETLSSVMGHTNIRTTQIYAKVVNKKVGEDMSELADKLRHLPFLG